ncbi:hypothetical protein LTR84_002321 [Exophiala bonariae]|uniref:Zn(2)-C6 fungal-type domain-containing protein n=1 Tax=Exophiala bonariae TaxID=1690606 RepID=A0AAV9NDA2_9EURO|nr:hypothetical protein LTR84_002321 [Exophiala bonariae]
MSRSTQGCWTCRIRHKKCDETRPLCKACTSRKVQCHGYGGKPTWLDGGALEQAHRKDIKKAVKQNFRLLRQSRSPISTDGRARTEHRPNGKDLKSLKRPARQGDLDISISPEFVELSNSELSSSLPLTAPPTSSSIAPQAQNSVPLGRNVFEYRDAELLMHYFDYVFPLQFRFLAQDLDKGGRGWLLWLLVKTGPLYQAALSLAALHQYTLRYRDQSEKYVELHSYHSKALRDLQLFLQENQATNTIGETTRQMEVLACGVSLISFELFRGGVSDWQLHLNALASIVQSLDPEVLPKSINSLLQSPSPSPPGPERAAFPFLVAVVLWFDLLSCASTGEAPRLAYQALLHDYPIKLEDVVGCQNWAMVAIGDLAILDLWKKQAEQDGNLSEADMLLRTQSIQEKLEDGLNTLELDCMAASSQVPGLEIRNNVVCKVTRIFASAALVQLHTIIHGAQPGQTNVKTAVERTIKALDQVQDHQDMRGLIWPICISGCMAEEHQQPMFEHLIKKVIGESLQDFGNSTTILHIMQKCWSMRLSQPNKQWNWQSAMAEMGICGLLV